MSKAPLAGYDYSLWWQKIYPASVYSCTQLAKPSLPWKYMFFSSKRENSNKSMLIFFMDSDELFGFNRFLSFELKPAVLGRPLQSIGAMCFSWFYSLLCRCHHHQHCHWYHHHRHYHTNCHQFIIIKLIIISITMEKKHLLLKILLMMKSWLCWSLPAVPWPLEMSPTNIGLFVIIIIMMFIIIIIIITIIMIRPLPDRCKIWALKSIVNLSRSFLSPCVESSCRMVNFIWPPRLSSLSQ